MFDWCPMCWKRCSRPHEGWLTLVGFGLCGALLFFLFWWAVHT